MANGLPPIPREPLQEGHAWRDWFFNLGRYIQIVNAGGVPWTVPQGGTGFGSATGWIKGNGTSPLTGHATIPYSDISGVPTPGVLSISTKTTAYTLVSSDYTIRADATGASFTITLPASPVAGQIYNIKKIDSTSYTVTVSGNGHNIDGASTVIITGQYDNIMVQYDSTSTTWNIL